MSNPINNIAAVIRQHPQSVDPDVLGLAIAVSLDIDRVSYTGDPGTVASIIRRVNSGRRMGAGALAEAIWNELDDEN